MTKHTVGITTKIDNAEVYTFIDLQNNKIIIKREGTIVFEGTPIEFKTRLNSVKADFDKAIYSDTLELAEELIELLSSK